MNNHRPRLALRRQRGFTLIELVWVIVILGILAAVAMPKLVELGTDSRIASVNQLAAAVRTAAHNGNAMCQVMINGAQLPAGSGPVIAPDGYSGNMIAGYPTATPSPAFSHITHWVSYNGFTVDVSNGLVTVFKLPSAPDPANCSVQYHGLSSLSYGQTPTITVTTSGC